MTLSLRAEKNALTWDRSPVPARLLVDAYLNDSTTLSHLLKTPWPVDSFSLGSLDQSSSVKLYASLDDGAGHTLIRCLPAAFAVADVSGGDVGVFCGRVGELTTFDATTNASGLDWGVALSDRYIVLGTKGDVSTIIFDRLALRTYESTSDLPVAPRTVAPLDDRSILLVSSDAVVAFDTYSGDTFDVSLDGIEPSEIVGATPITADDGTLFVVGATRPTSEGEASDAVLVIDPSGNVSAMRLSKPRIAASAAWVPDLGLVVLGGSEPANVEVLAPESTTFSPLNDTTLDAIEGASLALSNKRLLIVGGGTGTTLTDTLLLDLSCTESCAPKSVGDALGWTATQTFAQPNGTWFVRGQDPSTQLVDQVELSFNGTNASFSPITPAVNPGDRRGGVDVALGEGWIFRGGGVGSASSKLQLFTPR
ncbi:MAG: hypothetical protein U0165_08335 [Polyangiaceae bacterium]